MIHGNFDQADIERISEVLYKKIDKSLSIDFEENVKTSVGGQYSHLDIDISIDDEPLSLQIPYFDLIAHYNKDEFESLVSAIYDCISEGSTSPLEVYLYSDPEEDLRDTSSLT